ncbi:MAG: DUF86 domain-containing protein [Pirellulales bacterium]|nr:DUF86 domain-containing protein [Pirellulales bacterium]
MRDYAREAIDLLGSKTLEELQQERILRLALRHLVEIVGEASSRVDSDFKRLHPNVPWSKAAAMRHKLIHGYDAVNISIVYNTVRDHLPALLDQVVELLAATEDIDASVRPPPLTEGEAN